MTLNLSKFCENMYMYVYNNKCENQLAVVHRHDDLYDFNALRTNRLEWTCIFTKLWVI